MTYAKCYTCRYELISDPSMIPSYREHPGLQKATEHFPPLNYQNLAYFGSGRQDPVRLHRTGATLAAATQKNSATSWGVIG